jgi:poly-gamma-glutamate capsule biosynthesis protein CapA/YwtB (metallophosphatase superfamily)
MMRATDVVGRRTFEGDTAGTQGGRCEDGGVGSAVQVGTRPGAAGTTRLFLAGDVMLGRGVDQALRHAVEPGLHERFVRDARDYVELAERAHGPVGAPLAPTEPWGALREALAGWAPHARVVNLETALTTHGAPWPGKGIHYRAHPGNVEVLTSFGVDAAVLANNHVLDWGRPGLDETLATLRRAGVAVAGAGRNARAAAVPAAIETRVGRLLVVAACFADAGVPEDWGADGVRSGVWLLADPSPRGADALAAHVLAHRRPADVVIVSLHWGSNWGHGVPAWQRDFAQRLVGAGAADLVHGHSSHHPKCIEVVDGRAILYGAGDLINDYEGIEGHERFRADLALGYLVTLAADGRLASLVMVPLRRRRLRLERATREEGRWLATTLSRAGASLGTRVEVTGDGDLELSW